MRGSLLLLFAALPALADDAAFLKCRALRDNAARLACYDALPVPKGAGGPEARSNAAGQASASGSRPQEKVEQFGISQKDREAPLEAIESTIPGRFEGWEPRDRIAFANGQVWQIADDSKGYHAIDNPKVRVRRGALGAFYLEVEGTNRSPRVVRVK